MQYSKAKSYILHRLKHELGSKLYYHSYQHTLDVFRAAKEIAAEEGIRGEALSLLKTAALFHDSGFLINYQQHEAAGCDLVREVLPEFGYSGPQIEQICAMIMATRIPQTPTSKLGRILCDADLYYLGQDDFYATGQTLFLEFKERGIVQDEEDWNRLQVKFLESHAYFTQTAIRRRARKKALHLHEVKELVAGYAA
ncbi:MAG: HD domain-containing protein [Bacteroidota bacterium]